jgi:hypothetical protein
MGRPSKGIRQLVGSRVPVADARKLHAVAELEGVSVSDYLASIVHSHLAQVDVEAISSQAHFEFDYRSAEGGVHRARLAG